MHRAEAPVLIVGGSLVGMFAAALLTRQGVGVTVAERHRGTAIHPRAAMIYQRTMEIVRSFGIEQQVRERSYQQFEPDGAIMSVESIAGKELHWDIPHLNEGVRDLSPTERIFITQQALEPFLKQRAEESGADLRFSTELVTFEQDANGVTAQLRHRDTGETSTVRSRYMIAADGAHSPVRQQLGIPMRGRGLLSKSLTIYFRANVAPLMRGRNLSVILVRNQTFRGFFRIEKPWESGFMIVHTLGDPDNPSTDAWDLTEDRCLELLRIGLGEDIPATITSIQKWECEAHVAERWRDRRVFLAGDAAHVMPPYGGFGGNVGVHDAHNLAWKMAMVLDGRAEPGLLDTYAEERHPVAQLTTEQAYLRYVLRGAPYLGTADTQPFARDVNCDLGYAYKSAAIIPDEGEWRLDDDPRVLFGRPGTRAPHVPLEGGKSTIDLFGRKFVLLTGRDGIAWGERARTAAEQLSVPIEVHIGGRGALKGAAAAFEEAYGITATGATLVRPDGVVAWRAAADAPAETAAIRRALAAILSRPDASV